MSNKSSYILEQLGLALRTLCVGKNTIKKRLLSCYVYRLMPLKNDIKAVPQMFHKEDIDKLNDIIEKIEIYSNLDEPEPAEAFIERLSEDEASDIAEMILELQDEVNIRYYSHSSY